jgi:sigma-E factor negative regulatory protein RseB
VTLTLTPAARRRRRLVPLVLAAGVPGCLLTMTMTVSACSSQSGAAAGGQARSEASPANGGSGGGAEVSDQKRTQARKKSSSLAVSLMQQAAQAAVLMSYQGEEEVSRTDTGGDTTVMDSDVWHVSGGQTLTQTLVQGAGVSSQPYVSADSDGQSPEGVLGVTATLVKLLETNYVVSYAGVSPVDDRPAQIVEAWRADGSLAARFWLDSATKLPLERQVYDDSAVLISQGTFIDVQIGSQARPAEFAATTSWASQLAPAALRALNGHGWVVPSKMPGGLTLFAGGETSTPSGLVLDLSYSDGLFVVSVFEQRGKLATKLGGWQAIKLNGQVIYAAEPDQRSLTWSGHGMVYTMLADAPAQTVAAAVGALPHDKPPGFWKRISRGFARLAHMANPFG